MERTFPYKIEPLEEELMKEIKQKFLAYSCQGLVRVEGSGYVFPSTYAKYASTYYNYQFKPDDVLVMTHPRCGTTWTQEIVWTMRNGGQLDSSTELGVRSPFFEFDSLERYELKPMREWMEKDEDPIKEGFYLNLTNSVSSPRTIKTHLPFSLLNPTLLDTSKVIYVARNPKDTCVSYYHQQRLVKVSDFEGSFPEFLDYFCRDLITLGPFWQHVAEGWEKKDHPSVLFLFYEDMKEDIIRELRRINKFLGTGLTDKQLQDVAEHTKFSNMKARPTTNPTKACVEIGRFREGEQDFVRKGITGDWSNYFTPALEEKFQCWMEKWKDMSQNIPFKYNFETVA